MSYFRAPVFHARRAGLALETALLSLVLLVGLVVLILPASAVLPGPVAPGAAQPKQAQPKQAQPKAAQPNADAPKANQGQEDGWTQRDLDELATSFEKLSKAYEALSREVSREDFDPAALAARLGSDPAAAFAWVRDSTAYVPYRGALRGPAGVLMDRCGNGLDRALLLARLLRLGGHDVRLARGRLPDDVAEAMLRAAWDDPSAAPPAPPPSRDAAIAKALERIATENGVEPAALRAEIDRRAEVSAKASGELCERVTQDAARLEGLVKRALTGNASSPAVPAAAGAKAGDESAERAAMRAAIADHWWVERKDGDRWVALDPLARDAKPGTALAAPEATIDVPEEGLPALGGDALHEAEVRFVVERWEGGTTERHVVLEHVLRPAELAGEAASLVIRPVHWPDGLDPQAREVQRKIRAALLEETEWVPVLLVGSRNVTQKGFTSEGKIIDRPNLSPVAGIGRGVAGGIGGLFDRLDGALDEGPKAILTAAWLEVEIRAPDLEPTTVRRDVFDLFGPARRAHGAFEEPTLDEGVRLSRAAALVRAVDILPVGGIAAEAFVLQRSLAAFVEAGPKAAAALRAGAGSKSRAVLEDLASLPPAPLEVLTLAAVRRGPRAIAAPLAVDRLNLFLLHRGPVVGADGSIAGRATIDIAENGCLVRGAAGPAAFSARLRQGVLETSVEGLSVGGTGRGENAAAIFRAGGDWVALRGPEADADRLDLEPDVRARIDEDLRAGFVVVAPSHPVSVDGRPGVAWWRVDPATGACVGVLPDGTGGETAEYALLIKLVAVGNGVFTMLGCGGFAASTSGPKRLGCLVCGIVSGVLTYLAGAAALGSADSAVRAAGTLGGFLGGQGVSAACNALSGLAS